MIPREGFYDSDQNLWFHRSEGGRICFLSRCLIYGDGAFFEKSKRSISLETAKAILRAADPRIQKVAVVVSPSLAQAEEIEKAGFDYMQVHGVLGAEVLSVTRLPIIRAYNGKAEEEEDPRICAHLFDAAEPGSGKAFDWKRLAEKKRKKPWFLRAALRQPM